LHGMSLIELQKTRHKPGSREHIANLGGLFRLTWLVFGSYMRPAEVCHHYKKIR
jgi:hypothetical protein